MEHPFIFLGSTVHRSINHRLRNTGSLLYLPEVRYNLDVKRRIFHPVITTTVWMAGQHTLTLKVETSLNSSLKHTSDFSSFLSTSSS